MSTVYRSLHKYVNKSVEKLYFAGQFPYPSKCDIICAVVSRIKRNHNKENMYDKL